jgi:hypothetical protein
MPSRLFPLYNIDQPVGPGKANKPDDVRLVQALMIELSRFDIGDWVGQIPAQQRTLSTSGIFDDTLKQWVLAFQTWSKQHVGNYMLDGIIDPMPTQEFYVTTHFKGGHISTLGYLCLRLWNFNRDAYLRIGDDYRVPWIPKGWGDY